MKVLALFLIAAFTSPALAASQGFYYGSVLRPGQAIDLRAFLGLGEGSCGMRVDEVSVQATAALALVIDGETQDEGDQVLRPRVGANALCQDFSDAALVNRGAAPVFLGEIEVTLPQSPAI